MSDTVRRPPAAIPGNEHHHVFGSVAADGEVGAARSESVCVPDKQHLLGGVETRVLEHRAGQSQSRHAVGVGEHGGLRQENHALVPKVDVFRLQQRDQSIDVRRRRLLLVDVDVRLLELVVDQHSQDRSEVGID